MNNLVHFVSVVIPTYNRKDILKETIKSLLLQTYPTDSFEIIIVDDGSDDGTVDMIKKIDKGEVDLKYFRQNNSGPASARNLGVKNSKGDIILFIGDDCIPDSNLIEEHIKFHKNFRNIIVLGRIEWHWNLKTTPFMEFINRGAQFNYQAIKDSNNVSYNFFYTANISLSKNEILNIGLFDEDFHQPVMEDIELGYKLWRKGMRIVYNENAKVYHYHHIDIKKFMQRQKEAGKAAVLFYKKHPELREVLGIDDISNPNILYNFYDSSLKYYYVAGIAETFGKGGEELYPEEKLELTNKWLFELLMKSKMLQEQLEKLQQELSRKHQEFIKLQDFANIVKKTLVYKLYSFFIKPIKKKQRS